MHTLGSRDRQPTLRVVSETALLLTAYSAHLIESPECFQQPALSRYWQAARRLHQAWLQALGRCRDELDTAASPTEAWERMEPVLAELFVGDVLGRIWTAVLFAADIRWQRGDLETVGRSVLLGQLQVRHRALALMIDSPPALESAVARSDRLRRRAERWADLLLGQLMSRYDVGEFAVDAERAADFKLESAAPPGTAAWSLIEAGMRLGFAGHLPDDFVVSRPFGEITRAVLSCLPADAFDEHGRPNALWRTRLQRQARQPESAPPRDAAPPLPGRNRQPSGISFAKLRKLGDKC